MPNTYDNILVELIVGVREYGCGGVQGFFLPVHVIRSLLVTLASVIRNCIAVRSESFTI